MSDWHPIDSAPIDGTRMLVAHPEWTDGPWIGVWSVRDAAWLPDHSNEGPFWPQPTHWMPLPDLPASNQGDSHRA